MNQSDDNLYSSPLDDATAARLGRLRSMPMDTASLAARVRRSIPELAEQGKPAWRLWIRPVRAAAAVLVVAITIFAIVLAGSGGTAVASVDQLAQLHEQMIAGQSHGTRVDSIAAANAALEKEWPKGPDIPAIPQDHVMSCCVHEMGRKKMACVVLNLDGEPVTIAVAKSSEIKCPAGSMSMRDGLMYCSHSVRGVNMVMVQQDGQWTCYMGKVPMEKLSELASKSGEGR